MLNAIRYRFKDLSSQNLKLFILNYNCWSCKKELSDKESRSFFCPCEKDIILPVHEKNTYYDLFEILPEYDIDKKELTKKFRALMRKLHPDLYTLKSDLEKKYSSEQSSLLNKSYSVLNNPISRGLYLLKLNNINLDKEATHIGDDINSDKQEILMHVLELNEEIDDIESAKQVEELESKLYQFILPLKNELKVAFKNNNFDQAIRILTKMKYYQNVDERLQELKLKFNLTND